jgi:hypothetical protein
VCKYARRGKRGGEKLIYFTFESEKDEESEFIFFLFRIVYLTKETEMIITP